MSEMADRHRLTRVLTRVEALGCGPLHGHWPYGVTWSARCPSCRRRVFRVVETMAGDVVYFCARGCDVSRFFEYIDLVV